MCKGRGREGMRRYSIYNMESREREGGGVGGRVGSMCE